VYKIKIHGQLKGKPVKVTDQDVQTCLYYSFRFTDKHDHENWDLSSKVKLAIMKVLSTGKTKGV